MKSVIKKHLFSFSLTGSLILTIFTASAQKNHKIMESSTPKDSVIFKFQPAAQTWVVPAGVGQVHIDAYGAQGGGEYGGKGGRVETDFTVSPGTTLNIFTGGQPANAEGGYNGGGKGCGKGFGGGGATDIRVGGTALDNRVVVAGGGGGGWGTYGGNGTGEGGGLTGGTGKSMYDEKHHAPGGTQQDGGKGARAYLSKAGEAGVGGEGINTTGKCSNGGMCGGGGGYFGGGGGGAGNGGGGSSFTNKDNTNVIHTQGVNTGNGLVKIYWEKAAK